MLRSALAVIAGYLVVAIATVATFALVFPQGSAAAGRQPATPLVLALLGASILYATAGGYVTAVAAGRAELRHAQALGVLMMVLGIVSMVGSYGAQPLWFQIALVLAPLPAALAGGYLRARQRAQVATRMATP